MKGRLLKHGRWVKSSVCQSGPWCHLPMGALPCHPVPYCYAEEEVMAYVGMSCSDWGKHHPPPLYFRQAPDTSPLCYSKSGTPLQRLQPSLWVQETDMSSGLSSPPPLKLQGTSQPPLPLIKDQVLTKEVHGGSLLAPLQAVPHPPLQSGAPLASHGSQVKYDSWMWGCTADQAAGTSTWKTCLKDFISGYNLGKEMLSQFLSQMRYCLLMFMLAGNVRCPWVLSAAGAFRRAALQGVLHHASNTCRLSGKGDPTRAWAAFLDRYGTECSESLTPACSGYKGHLRLSAELCMRAPSRARPQQGKWKKIKTPYRITTPGGLWS